MLCYHTTKKQTFLYFCYGLNEISQCVDAILLSDKITFFQRRLLKSIQTEII